MVTQNKTETASACQKIGFTPGPWFFRPDGMTIEAVHATGLFLGIANMSGKHIFKSDEMHANARLIAAAPDLLAALNLIATVDPSIASDKIGQMILSGHIATARAAIAIAKGGK